MAKRIEAEPIQSDFWIIEDFEDRNYVQCLVESIMDSPNIFRPSKYKNHRDKVIKIDSSSDGISFLVDELTADKLTKDKTRYISVELYNSKIEYYINWSKSDNNFKFQSICIALKIPYQLDFNLTPDKRFKCMSIDAKSQNILEDFLGLIKTLIPIIKPVYGEFSDLAPVYSTDRPFDLKLRLPDTQQISIYGTSYIDLFSRAKIESAPFERIEKIGSEYYWLEATASIFETVSAEKKQAIRQHFGEDYFMDGGKERLPSGKKRYTSGISPSFDFSKTAI